MYHVSVSVIDRSRLVHGGGHDVHWQSKPPLIKISAVVSTMASLSPSHSRSVSPTSVPTTKGSWTAQTRNPVSLRLYKVLGSNFGDDATKEALRTLSELYITPKQSTARDRVYPEFSDGNLPDSEVERTASSRPENVLSESVPGESAAKARKNLRRDMEAKLAEGSRQFLKAFGEVDEVGSFV